MPNIENDRVRVEYCSHTIVPWAVEEMCAGCHQRATHKVEETSGPRSFHPLTAYLCCGCFSIIGDCSNYPYDTPDTPWVGPETTDLITEEEREALLAQHYEHIMRHTIPPGTGDTNV